MSALFLLLIIQFNNSVLVIALASMSVAPPVHRNSQSRSMTNGQLSTQASVIPGETEIVKSMRQLTIVLCR